MLPQIHNGIPLIKNGSPALSGVPCTCCGSVGIPCGQCPGIWPPRHTDYSIVVAGVPNTCQCNVINGTWDLGNLPWGMFGFISFQCGIRFPNGEQDPYNTGVLARVGFGIPLSDSCAVGVLYNVANCDYAAVDGTFSATGSGFGWFGACDGDFTMTIAKIR